MTPKEQLLAEVQAGLQSGLLSEADLQRLVTHPSTIPAVQASSQSSRAERLSAVDAMFYIAGIILFATIMSIILQSWSVSSHVIHILLSAGIGVGMWSLACYLVRSPLQNDIRKGLTNALLLTGSLLVIVGGYITAQLINAGYNATSYAVLALLFTAISGAHISLDRLLHRNLILLLGILLGVAAFPTLIIGFLRDVDDPKAIVAATMIVSSGLLAYATRVVSKLCPGRQGIRAAFDPLAAFMALFSMYVASFNSYGVFWLGLLIASVLGIFYLSIVLQNKYLLSSGSFFLVLTIITLSFRYFSGFGVTTSLVIATLGMLGSAAVAAAINRKYFSVP